MTPRRVLIFAVVAAILYAAFGYWVVTNFEIPAIRGSAWALVVVAVVCQIGAKWFFGMQFRESAEVVGEDIPLWPAFKAALVGAGVARLIPVGGAVTPVAMSWTVRDEAEGTAGAAIRATFLNYAGLLIVTGLGLLVARPIDDRLAIGQVSLVVLAPFVLIAGLAVMFGSGKLGTINKYLPAFLRNRLEESMVNHTPGWESQLYIWARLVLEAAALWLVLIAFNIEVNAFQVLAAFGGSQIVGGLPGMPGGLGVTEGTLAVILAAYGFPVSTTIAPVLVFRIVSYWLPAALGFLAGGSTFLTSEEARSA